jgi:hypothetical protein
VRFWGSGTFAIHAVVGVSILSAQTPQQPRRPRAGLIQGTEVVVVATDQGLEAPDQADAGLLNLRLFNRGRQLHSLILLKVDRLDRIASIAETLRNNDWNLTWLKALGGPGRVGPGGMSSGIVVVEPGRYVLADLGDGPPQGRLTRSDVFLKELAVLKPTGSERAIQLPETEVTLSMTGWSFNLSGPLYAGRRTVNVVNNSPLDHNMWLVRLAPGRTTTDALRWLDRPHGVPPFEALGGTTAIAPGRAINVTFDLLPGDYTLICGLLNPLSKRTHADHGMVKQLTVTR